MFIALRRLCVLFTLFIEWYFFKQHHKQAVIMAVFLMCFGSMVAAFTDLSFSLYVRNGRRGIDASPEGLADPCN